MTAITALLAAAFVAAEGGEELRLFQTTESKDFREIATSGFSIHPYPSVEALDIDNAIERHEFLGLGASLTDASAWILANMPKEKREKLLRELFTPEGCNLGAIRLNIGASDYSTAIYNYNDPNFYIFTQSTHTLWLCFLSILFSFPPHLICSIF